MTATYRGYQVHHLADLPWPVREQLLRQLAEDNAAAAARHTAILARRRARIEAERADELAAIARLDAHRHTRRTA